MLTTEEYHRRLRRVRLLASDVDGVMTDGSIVYLESDEEAKVFQVRDGSGVFIARLLGLDVVVITARRSEAVARRFGELPVSGVHQDTFDKLGLLRRYEERLGLAPEEIAYLGDDLVDLASIRHAGVGITVADGHPRVRDAADWVTERSGGRGAFREVVDDIVTAREAWEEVLEDYERRQSGSS